MKKILFILFIFAWQISSAQELWKPYAIGSPTRNDSISNSLVIGKSGDTLLTRGPIFHRNLPSAGGDTTNYKPLGFKSSTGEIKSLSHWMGSGGAGVTWSGTDGEVAYGDAGNLTGNINFLFDPLLLNFSVGDLIGGSNNIQFNLLNSSKEISMDADTVRLHVTASGKTRDYSLSGTGTRMVTATSTGVLGTSTIPSGAMTHQNILDTLNSTSVDTNTFNRPFRFNGRNIFDSVSISTNASPTLPFEMQMAYNTVGAKFYQTSYPDIGFSIGNYGIYSANEMGLYSDGSQVPLVVFDANLSRIHYGDHLYESSDTVNATGKLITTTQSRGDNSTKAATTAYADSVGKWRFYIATATATTVSETAGNVVYDMDCTSNVDTLKLPTAVGNSFLLTVRKKDSGVNKVVVKPAGSELINGQSSLWILYQYTSVDIYSNNTGYYTR